MDMARTHPFIRTGPKALNVGPNNAGNAVGTKAGGGGDQSAGCNASGTLGFAQLVQLGMGCANNTDSACIGPKSQHPGGVLSVFCDGSVHWIDDNIEVGTPPGKGAGVAANGTIGYYEMLFIVSDGGNVPQDVYNQ